jgi:HK97 gp10 family phage protein
MIFEIEGLDELRESLRRYETRTNAAIDRALLEAAELAQREMQNNVNISTRNETHIKYNIVISPIMGFGVDKYIYIGAGLETAWRAHFVEFGTSKMSARPFMSPVIANSRAEIMGRISRILREELNL